MFVILLHNLAANGDWPTRGEVCFQGVCLRYRPSLPPVLHNLSFAVKPCEKIGIVGRTGAGQDFIHVYNLFCEYHETKSNFNNTLDVFIRNLMFCFCYVSGKSSLLTALLRLVEIDSGVIYIDGVDISQLPLSQLRRAVAVIPQDPVLFSGDLRSNLDPFRRHSDQTLLDMLRQCRMAMPLSQVDQC